MSKFTLDQIVCPDCGNEQSFENYESINATIDPDLKERLLSRKLNRIICQKCNKNLVVDSDLLYHDMDKQYMVWRKDELTQIGENSLYKTLPGEYNFRLVRSLNDLIEKVLIFDSEVDDLTVEIIKMLLIRQRNYDLEKEIFFFRKYAEYLVFHTLDGNDIIEDEIDILTYQDAFEKRNAIIMQFDLSLKGWRFIDRQFIFSIAEKSI